MINDIVIRAACLDDAQRLSEIYAWYVENTAVTYEYDAPSAEEFRRRMAGIMKQYPYLVAERGGKLLGYAYAGRFREREAYKYNAESSVYLCPEARGQGIGKMLYSRLESILCAQGLVKLFASITEASDERSDCGSLKFHESMGFGLVGRLENCGYKFGSWYTTLIAVKNLQNPGGNMQDIISFEELRGDFGL